MQRIVAMLYSLAGLLDRALSGPRPVCWFLVCLMRPAEPIIRRFVILTAWEAGAVAIRIPDHPDHDWDCYDQAFQLAACFRALAIALERLPSQLYERWRTCPALMRATRETALRLGRLPIGPSPAAPSHRPGYHDTS